MNVLLACMYLYHMCAWYLQVRRCGALWNWSLWSKMFGALASVLVPMEVRGVRFPLGLKLQRAVNCLLGVLGIEVRFSWRCMFLRLYFIFLISVCVCGNRRIAFRSCFSSTLCSREWTQVASSRCFTCWATQGLVFQMKLLKHFSHLCKCIRCWV